ncbi:MAG: hypothetical protein IJ757_01080 [Clostridiales bacterium]|nr:hypothetical protein [Clostridiales bacterium]
MGKQRRQQNSPKNQNANQTNNHKSQSDRESVSDDKTNEKLERSKYVYEQVNNWIENADNKVSVSCGIFSGVFTIITFLSGRISASATVNNCWRMVYLWCFAISLLFMSLSILLYVLAINPNLGKSGEKKKGTVQKKKYPVFYGDIAELSLADYKKMMENASDTDFINELQDEIHYNSGICTAKMRKYRIGLWLSFIAIVFALGSWAARFLMFH